jgi:integrase
MDAEEIKTRHVLEAVEPIWLETPTQAKTVLSRIEVIFDDLIARGDRTAANPARWMRHLEHVLPDPALIRATKHHPWIPFERVPEFIAALRPTGHIGAGLLEFLILTIMRPNEVRLARWDEIDEDTRVWTAQPEDIKGRREERDEPHRVPLSDPAMEIIAEQKKVRNGPFLFPRHQRQ